MFPVKGLTERKLVKMARIKYIRVSTTHQNTQRQEANVEAEGFDKVFKSTKGKKCKLVGDISGRYGFREFVPVSYFGKPERLMFEDIMIHVPKEYDKYLTRIYGDYMTLPPEEARVSDHIKIVED